MSDVTVKRVPELRFFNFFNFWEKVRLSDIVDVVGGGTPSTSNLAYWGGSIDWYSPFEITDKVYVSGSTKKITQLGLKKSSAHLLPVGTVLFTSRAGIGKTAILSKEGATNQGFQSFVPKRNKVNSYFLFSNTYKLKRYGEKVGSGSTFSEVSGKQMSKMKIFIPNIKEQEKIGTFFEQLDKLITLQQRKIDLLKKQKQGYLQKMFPKAGERVPELRFAGFSDEWKKDKLGNVAKVYDGTHQTPNYINHGVMFLSVENIKSLKSRKYISEEDFEKEFKIYPEYGDILMTRIGDVGTFNVVKNHSKIAYYVSLALIKTKSLDSYFLNNVLKSNVLQREIWKRTLHIAFPKKINKNEIGLIYLSFPKLKEQKKIGSFFKQIDENIQLQSKKLDSLKELKKGFLQKMFI